MAQSSKKGSDSKRGQNLREKGWEKRDCRKVNSQGSWSTAKVKRVEKFHESDVVGGE